MHAHTESSGVSASSNKDTNPICSGPHPMTSLNLNYLLTGPFPKYSHTGGVRALIYEFEGDANVQSIVPPSLPLWHPIPPSSLSSPPSPLLIPLYTQEGWMLLSQVPSSVWRWRGRSTSSALPAGLLLPAPHLMVPTCVYCIWSLRIRVLLTGDFVSHELLRDGKLWFDHSGTQPFG